MIRRLRESPGSLLGPFLVVAVTATLAVGVFDLRSQATTANEQREAIEETQAQQNEVVCAIADLVAHVPAVQFEGEPLENFLGWVNARRALLDGVREDRVCEPSVVRALDERITIDTDLLRQIRRGR